MVRIIAFIIAVTFALTALPSFAQQAQSARGENLFQVMYDSMEEEYNAREKKPLVGGVTNFEDGKTALNAMDAASAKVKNLSIKGNEAEILKRRNAK